MNMPPDFPKRVVDRMKARFEVEGDTENAVLMYGVARLVDPSQPLARSEAETMIAGLRQQSCLSAEAVEEMAKTFLARVKEDA